MNDCPPSLQKILDLAGLKIVYDDLSRNIGGALDPSPFPRFIVINRQHHPVDQEFSIAHEIGHYQMRHHRTRKGSLPTDTEADLHAYGLLWYTKRFRAIARALLRKPWQLPLALAAILLISPLILFWKVRSQLTSTSEKSHD